VTSTANGGSVIAIDANKNQTVVSAGGYLLNPFGIATVNGSPAISNLSDPTPYRIGSGTKVIDQGTPASFAENGVSNFSGGKLTVSFTSGATSADQLGIRTSGGPFTVSSNIVSYNNVSIGTITGNGVNGVDLVVIFNSGAQQKPFLRYWPTLPIPTLV